MRKVAAFLLLVPVLFQAGGVLLLCVIMQIQIRQNLSHTIQDRKDHVQRISIPVELYFNCLQDRNEIKLEGKLYDIQKVTFTEGKAVLELYHDLREQQVLASLDGFLNGSESAREFSSTLFKILSANYLVTPSGQSPSRTPIVETITCDYVNHFSSFDNENPTPPPKPLA